ncbi:MAG: hypothetical protein M3Q48_10745 [Actinomycetota bacterium]|nr:hypothetical protein [Actinomycetota bacterium]
MNEFVDAIRSKTTLDFNLLVAGVVIGSGDGSQRVRTGPAAPDEATPPRRRPPRRRCT